VDAIVFHKPILPSMRFSALIENNVPQGCGHGAHQPLKISNFTSAYNRVTYRLSA
jgi:hypothetical protein